MKRFMLALLMSSVLFSFTACEEKKQEPNGEQVVKSEDGKEKETEEIKYVDELVKVKVKGGELAGILTTPKEMTSSVPVVLLVPGSGPVPKNGTANEFEQLSVELANKGIASLRYDKRGSFDSNNIQIDEDKIRVMDYVNDISSLIQFLSEDTKFSDVYLLGHSQGALYGALAIKDTKVDGFLSVAGAGRTIDVILKEQIKENDLNPPDVVTETNDVLNRLKKGEKVPEVSKLIEPLFKPSIQNYLIDWISYDPIEAYKAIADIPIIIIQGKNDIQIKEKDAKLLAEALENIEPVLIDKMSHVLKDAPTKEDRENHIKIYSNVKEPLNKEFVENVIRFVNDHRRNEAQIAERKAKIEQMKKDKELKKQAEKEGALAPDTSKEAETNDIPKP